MIEVFKDDENLFRFQLKTDDGNSIFKSVSFETKDEAERMVSVLKPLILQASGFERKTNYQGKFLFNLKGATGQLIGNSPLYDSEAGMENGIKNLKTKIDTLNI
ncbi:DUF1508 domain-containing protein [Maribacter sp. 2-571]|uniref:YegP family protein n=1 Tax=Maribacter sp. 2-571 TaxID=3417569 RepID=UPI003D354B96